MNYKKQTTNNELFLNLGHLYLPALRSPQGEGWVSPVLRRSSTSEDGDFDIRISDFNHSGCFMQNKPNFLKDKTNATFFAAKDYENKPRLPAPGKQTQFIPTEGGSNPILSAIALAKADSKGKNAALRSVAQDDPLND